MRYVVVCAGQLTHVYVLRYWLGMAMNAAVVKVGLGRKCCSLRSAYHGSPNRSDQRETVSEHRRRGDLDCYDDEHTSDTPWSQSVHTNPAQWVTRDGSATRKLGICRNSFQSIQDVCSLAGMKCNG